MNEMSFSLRLGAKDDSQAGLRSWQSSIMGAVKAVSKPITIPLKIAGAGLGLLRDINLGLKPLIEGLDHIIERGTTLDATRKSFISMVGGGAAYADQLAERLVAASHGTLRVAEAMQLANRSMAAGIDTSKTLPTILDFASKKAVTTGMDFGGAMERIIMGLSRGSAAILDDFGLLNDGLEGVQRAYESIKGKGTWEQLGPAAQKAELIRQAMEDMHRQLGRLGVRGTETIFVWKQIKTQIGDATDKLMAAVGRSESLRGVLGGIRDMIGGMTRHLEGGGSLGELLFGKTDKETGKPTGSGGLFGGLKAVLLDAGEALGRGILGGLLKGLSLLPDLLNRAWEGLKSAWQWAINELPPKIISAFEWLKSDFLPALKDALTEWRQESIEALAGWFKGFLVDENGNPTWAGKFFGVAEPRSLYEESETLRGPDGQPLGSLESAWLRMRAGFGTFAENLSAEWADVADWLKAHTTAGQMLYPKPATTQPAGVGMGYGFGLGVAPVALSAAAMGIKDDSLLGRAGTKGEEILSGGVLGGNWRGKGWIEKFRGDFPAKGNGPKVKPERKLTRNIEESLGWGPQERLRQSGELRRLSREIVKTDPGRGLGPAEMREVNRETDEEMRRLRRTGRQIRVDTRGRVREQILLRHMGERDKRREGLTDEYKRRRGEYLGETGPEPTTPATGTAGRAGEKQAGSAKVEAQLEKIVNNTAAMVAAIGGVDRAATG